MSAYLSEDRTFRYSLTREEHSEHLHFHCRCGFDWIGPVLS